MPLLDHFDRRLLDDPPWTSPYTMWAAGVVRWLNQTLPAGEFRAFANVPLALRRGPLVSPDLEGTYTEAVAGSGL